MKPRARGQLLGLVEALDDDVEFWEHQSNGLGIFVSGEDSMTAVALPGGLDNSFSYVGSSFHMRHLIPSLDMTVLPVLMLTMNQVGLYRVTKGDIESLDVDLPESFEDVNWFVDRESQRQQHPDRAGTSRNRHGHEPSAKLEEDRSRFLRAVAEAMPGAVEETTLIVLGDDNLVDSFEHIYGREMLSPENSGLDDPSPQAIHARSLPVLETFERSVRSEHEKSAMESLGRDEASTNIENAIQHALEGRIGTLLIQSSLQPVWGQIRDSANLALHDSREAGDVDLLDRLAVLSRDTGAQIVAIDEPIDGHGFVALLRY